MFPRISCQVKQLIFVFILGGAIAGCSDTTLGTKSFTESQTFTVPGAPISIGVQEPVAIPIPLDLSEQDINDDDLTFVTSITVRGITLGISPTSSDPSVEQLFGEDGNLDTFEFVQSLSIALQAVVNGETRTVQIADLPMNDPQIASNATTLSLNTNSDGDVRDLLEAPEGSTIIVSIAGNLPPDNVVVDVDILFRVGVGIR